MIPLHFRVLPSESSNWIMFSLVPVETCQQSDHQLRQLGVNWFSILWPAMEKGGSVICSMNNDYWCVLEKDKERDWREVWLLSHDTGWNCKAAACVLSMFEWKYKYQILVSLEKKNCQPQRHKSVNKGSALFKGWLVLLPWYSMRLTKIINTEESTKLKEWTA